MARPQISPSVLSNIRGILTADLATAGTLQLAYPKLQPSSTVNTVTKNKGHFFGIGGHKLVTANAVYTYPNDFEIGLLAPGSTGITVTYRGASTIPANTPFTLQLNEMGNIVRGYGGPGSTQLFPGQVGGMGVAGGASGPDTYLINLGAAITLNATNVCTAQAATGGATGSASLTGSIVLSGAAYMDVPRAVQIVSSATGDTGQAVKIVGTDVYGQAMTEQITPNGTTAVSGKKAFFTVTSVRYTTNFAGSLSVGTTDILGLPIALYGGAGYILKEVSNGSSVTGTLVSAGTLTPSATTADVRGTYTPGSANNGTNALHLIVWAMNPGDIGQAQFST